MATTLFRFGFHIAAGLASVLAGGCGGGGVPPLPPPQPITVALPYVEAVHVPAEIHAGQPFAIVFDLSCEQSPNALWTPSRPFAPDDLLFAPSSASPHSICVVLYRDLAQINAEAPVASHVSFSIPGLSAGEHRLSYLTARTRQEGGLQMRVDRVTWMWLGQGPYPSSQYIELTVLP